MAASKLFTPKLHITRGSALDATQGEGNSGRFLNPPNHAAVNIEQAPTSGADWPLKMSQDSGVSMQKPGQRIIRTRPQEEAEDEY